jgi:thioredoxin-related protein
MSFHYLYKNKTKTMIKKLLYAATLVAGSFLFGQGVKFEEGKFSEILAKAKKENKLVFIDAYTSWCAPCKLMVKNIFPLQSVSDYYNTHFISAKIDMEKGEGIQLAKKYKVNSYPTYLFIDGNGEVIHRGLGYFEEKDFIQLAKDADDPNKKLAVLKKKFEKGEKSPEFLNNLASLADSYGDKELAVNALRRYFEAKQGKDFTEKDFNFILFNTKTTDAPTYIIFQERKDDILQYISEEEYNKSNNRFKLNTISKKSYNQDTKLFDEKYFLSEVGKIVGNAEAEKYLQKEKAEKALKNKDFATYEKISLDLYKDPSKEDSGELAMAAWNFYEKATDKFSLERATLWAQEAVNKGEDPMNTGTLANLYNKIGDKKNAKIWAEKSIEIATKQYGKEAVDPDMIKLLDSLK